MKRWQARVALLLLTAAVVTPLCLIDATPATGLFFIDGGEPSPLILWLADILLGVAAVFAGIALLVGLVITFVWLFEEAFK